MPDGILGDVDPNHLAILGGDCLLFRGKNNRDDVTIGLGGGTLAQYGFDDPNADIVSHHFVPDCVTRDGDLEHLAILSSDLLVDGRQ